MKQKIIRIGSSIGVVIPKPLAKKLDMEAGQEVELHTNAGIPSFIVSKPGVSPDIKEVLETVYRASQLIERYRPAFEALSQK